MLRSFPYSLRSFLTASFLYGIRHELEHNPVAVPCSVVEFLRSSFASHVMNNFCWGLALCWILDYGHSIKVSLSFELSFFGFIQNFLKISFALFFIFVAWMFKIFRFMTACKPFIWLSFIFYSSLIKFFFRF